MTITRVVVEQGAIQPPHMHPTSEQIWVAVSGQGMLLLGAQERKPISAGDVARFADGDVHGFENTGSEPFVYLSVTAPPIDFSYAYQQAR